METIILILGWVMPAVCAALITALVASLKSGREAKSELAREKSDHDKLVDKGMKVLLRRELVDAYRDHVTNNIPLTVERFHEISEVHDTYNGFGGNGTGDAMFDAIRQKQILIVQTNEEKEV